MNHGFSQEELNRYSRHLALPDFDQSSQLKLKAAKVTVVGAGGLGSPVLLYLAAAGVGEIQIIDDDLVTISNLQRQILFSVDDVGKSKVEIARLKLLRLNPTVNIIAKQLRIQSANALELLAGSHLVIDCTDNFPTRYLLNDACQLLNKPWIYGSIFRYEGQVSVFNLAGGPDYRDLYPAPPKPNSIPDCEQGGVIGSLAGIIGSIQANEAIKIIADIGVPLTGKLLVFDSASMQTTVISIPSQSTKEKVKNLIDYDEYCGLKKSLNTMKEVTVQELKKLIDAKTDFQLIDVREPHEWDICHLNGELIPQAEIPQNVDRISKTKQVVIHCRSGARSGNMVQWLEKNHGFTNLYNLKGGIKAWAAEIDPTMPTY
ncbi:MAG TPA: molybdopterin-synthase adenylyltransferase MoeB [Cyclobacteriaceae bacterium]|nr:molybdopterin-synthase adenylyltransferase MoeB [Cyclobacteriaceae bacterium]